MTNVDIAEFLTARLDAEWQLAVAAQGRYAGGEPWGPTWAYDREHFRVVIDGQTAVAAKDTRDVDGEHIAYWDPARVLADIAAKRRIVERHGAFAPRGGSKLMGFWKICTECGSGEEYQYPTDWPCDTLRLLAALYADHPDFDPAWRIDG